MGHLRVRELRSDAVAPMSERVSFPLLLVDMDGLIPYFIYRYKNRLVLVEADTAGGLG
jgi:hypothetical protein